MSSYMIRRLKLAISTMVACDKPDLTGRQLAVFLKTYIETIDQTVRGLAETLNISKPAVTRALDRLEEFKYIARSHDPKDRRSIIVQKTPQGQEYLEFLEQVFKSSETNVSIVGINHDERNSELVA